MSINEVVINGAKQSESPSVKEQFKNPENKTSDMDD